MKNGWYIAGLGVFCVVLAAVLLSRVNPSRQGAAVGSLPQTSTTTPEARLVPNDCGQILGEGCVGYDNSRYAFSLFAPASEKVSVHDEGGGASTITFEDTQDVRGFQIFVVPYAGTQVTQQRFIEDEPSGVREDLTAISIDGATGASFYSQDARLGDTFEVWFIHNGYLYEATTLKAYAPQLIKQLTFWKFNN